MIPCLKLKSGRDWDLFIFRILLVRIDVWKIQTGFTANRLLLEQELQEPIHVKFGMVHDRFENVEQYVRKLDEIMRDSRRIIRDNLKGALSILEDKIMMKNWKLKLIKLKILFINKSLCIKDVRNYYQQMMVLFVTRVLSPFLLK